MSILFACAVTQITDAFMRKKYKFSSTPGYSTRVSEPWEDEVGGEEGMHGFYPSAHT